MLGLTTDAKDWLQSLNDAGAEYLVVGAHAMAYHGYVRMTGDIDTWINPTVENARKVLAAIADFGMHSLGITEADLTNPDMIMQIGQPPNRLDIITSISGVSFNDAYKVHERLNYHGLEIPILALHHLRVNKQASGRSKDLEDLKHLPSAD